WVYISYGGILGYIEKAMDLSNPERMQDMGMVYMISEAFPILAMMVYAVYVGRISNPSHARGKGTGRGWVALFLVLAVFFVLKMLFGGLRGSRSNTIWGLFWAVGIIHLWLRPIPRMAAALGLVGLVGFMYLYGLYKADGPEAATTFGDAS